jgi:hypothetical protein
LVIIGPFTVRSRSVYGPFTVRSRSVHGPFTVRSRSVHGPFTVRSRSVHGPVIGPSSTHRKAEWAFRRFGPLAYGLARPIFDPGCPISL